MRVWCGDYETDEWALAIPVDTLITVILSSIVVLAIVGVGYYYYYTYQKEQAAKAKAKADKEKADEAEKKKLKDAAEKAEKETAEQAQKVKDAEAKAKAAADAVKKRADELLRAKENMRKALDAKLRELQDGHRTTMISDNYNRIMWIAEGIRQARDALENIKAGDIEPI